MAYFPWDPPLETAESDPISRHFVSESFSAADQEDGTTYYYIDMDGFRYFSIQVDDTPGVAGDQTYTIEATNQDDGTAAASCSYDDVTNAWLGVASFATDFYATRDTPVACKYIRIKVVRANDGEGNEDGAWDIYVKKLY